MKILLISNMYPSEEKPYAGIFVKSQFIEIKRLLGPEDSIEIFYMKRQFTSPLGTVFKYLRAFISFTRHLFRRYDIVHLHFFYPLIYLVWIYKKIHPKTKIAVTFHGKDITTLVHDKNKRQLRKIARIIDFTIPVGKTIAAMMKEKLELAIGKILPVGVNNNVFYYDNNQAKEYDFIWIGSFIHRKGNIGIVSRSGTLTYEAVDQITKVGLGQSTCIGIGGDPIIGTTTRCAVKMLMEDPDTHGIVMIGEIGGNMEAEAAYWVKENGTKPVVGFIAGQTAPKGKRMGHAGAIIGGKSDTAAAKMEIMRDCGIHVVESPAEIGAKIAELLK